MTTIGKALLALLLIVLFYTVAIAGTTILDPIVMAIDAWLAPFIHNSAYREAVACFPLIAALCLGFGIWAAYMEKRQR